MRRGVVVALLAGLCTHRAGAHAAAEAARCAAPFPPVDCLVPGAAPAARTGPPPVRAAAAAAPARVDRTRTATQAALPASREALFGDAAAPVASVAATAAVADASAPDATREALFGAAAPTPRAPAGGRPSVRGFVQFAPAYTYASPSHWSRAVVRAQAEASGQLGAGVKYKASLRADLDPVYMTSNFYPDPVREDQRAQLQVRETYLDFALPGAWEMRVGRQQIVWGEVVGMFVADVVSARDLRDFILPDFEILRIPQWAARAEYFGSDWHGELVWIPLPSYDDIGKPGAEFYPFPIPATPGLAQKVLDDRKPAQSLGNTNYGARASRLVRGWDLSGFYYTSMSTSPTLYRTLELSPAPAVVFEPRHDRIHQAGATLTKDFGRVVLRAEGVYTAGRSYEITNTARAQSAVRQDTLDYVVGLDFMLPSDGRLNLQTFQRYFLDHDADIAYDAIETGVSVLVSAKVTPTVEPELLWIQSLSSSDRLVRPRVNWAIDSRLAARLGVDVFDGPQYGVFGRFRDRDRIYAELRYAF
jgi:hypothetical protein